MNELAYYTYFHTRNDTGAVFYVGKGKGGRAHSKNRNLRWKRMVAKHGHTVHMAMTSLTEADAFEHEKFLIACFRDIGAALTNCTDGGEGSSGRLHSEETRVKISSSAKGRVITSETRAKLSAALKGRVFTPETIAKRSAALKGHAVSQDTRAKIGAANMGNKYRLGQVVTPETRAKLSAAQTARLARRATEAL